MNKRVGDGMSRFVLKHYNQPLIVFEFGNTIQIEWMTNETHLLPMGLQENRESLSTWLKERVSATQRTYGNRIWKALNISPTNLVDVYSKTYGLSVTDVYWVVPESMHGRFEDYNLYDNTFSEDIGRVAFTGGVAHMAVSRPSPEVVSSGVLPKQWHRVGGQLYLYKWGYHTLEHEELNRKSYNEYYASQVAQAMGVSHVPYELDVWEDCITSICPNFTNKDVSFVQIKDTVKDYTFPEVQKLMHKYECEVEFGKLILLDAILNNVGRGCEDYGFLRDNHTGDIIGLAPSFDFGMSFFYELDDNQLLNEDTFVSYFVQHSAAKIGFEHNQLVTWTCDASYIPMLETLYSFHFERHALFNFSERRLFFLENYIQCRAHQFVKLLKKISHIQQHEEGLPMHHMNGTYRGHDYQMVGNATRGGQLIVMSRSKDRIRYKEIKAARFEEMTQNDVMEAYIDDLYFEGE